MQGLNLTMCKKPLKRNRYFTIHWLTDSKALKVLYKERFDRQLKPQILLYSFYISMGFVIIIQLSCKCTLRLIMGKGVFLSGCLTWHTWSCVLFLEHFSDFNLCRYETLKWHRKISFLKGVQRGQKFSIVLHSRKLATLYWCFADQIYFILVHFAGY